MARGLTKWMRGLSIAFGVMAGLAGCADYQEATLDRATSTAEIGSATIAAAAPKPIKVASFNIQVFGETKRSKSDVMAILVEIAAKYDILAIQEVRDDTETTVDYFVDAINSTSGARYAALSGPRLGRTNSKEQYAFIYNTAKVQYLANTAYTYADPGDHLHREPYIARFRSGQFTFVLVDVHTDPDDVANEIAALDDVVKDALRHFPGEGDVITLGDFNADCDAFNPERHSTALQGPAYRWIVPDDADTTVATKPCAYDRIVIRDAATSQDWRGDWGIERFDNEFHLTPAQTKAVSDHYPVWAEFSTTADTDGLPGS